MPANSFLVLGVLPANNEQQVPINTSVTISFAKHMDVSTLTESTINFRKVNGENIPFTLNYNLDTYQLVLTPLSFLEGNVQYQVEVIGGATGIKSVTGDYTNTRTYEFVTVLVKAVSQPRNLTLVQSGANIKAQWVAPEVSTEGESISYEVRVSASNDLNNPAIWPTTDSSTIDLGSNPSNTVDTFLSIPFDFELGRNYYVMVRAITSSSTGDWTVSQIYLEKEEDVDEAPVEDDEPSTPAPVIEQIEIVEAYPAQGGFIEDNTIYLVFSDELISLPTNAVYVVQAPYKATLSTVDLLTKYSPSKAIAGSIGVLEGQEQVLRWTTTEELPVETEYTVVVNKNIVGKNTDSLGVTTTYGFRTPWERLYGSIKTIKERLGSVAEYVSDSFIYEFMGLNTKFAYETVSATSTFEDNAYTSTDAPYYIHQYVNLQTAYDVFLNSATMGGSGGGSEAIVLGSLEVTKDGAVAGVTADLETIKSEIKPWLDMVHGHRNRGYAKPVSAVKGEAGATYPDYFTRSELKTDFDV